MSDWRLEEIVAPILIYGFKSLVMYFDGFVIV